jgi:hypothetical protein
MFSGIFKKKVDPKKTNKIIDVNICREKLKEADELYSKNDKLFLSFDQIKDDISIPLNKQFQDITKIRNDIYEFFKKNNNITRDNLFKVNLDICNKIIDSASIFDDNIKKFETDLFNYINDKFANSLKILETYVIKINKIHSENPDNFESIIGAEYSVIEGKVLKIRSLIEAKFKKIKTFMEKYPDPDPNKYSDKYSKIIKVFETKITLNSEAETPVNSSENSIVETPANPPADSPVKPPFPDLIDLSSVNPQVPPVKTQAPQVHSVDPQANSPADSPVKPPFPDLIDLSSVNPQANSPVETQAPQVPSADHQANSPTSSVKTPVETQVATQTPQVPPVKTPENHPTPSVETLAHPVETPANPSADPPINTSVIPSVKPPTNPLANPQVPSVKTPEPQAKKKNLMKPSDSLNAPAPLNAPDPLNAQEKSLMKSSELSDLQPIMSPSVTSETKLIISSDQTYQNTCKYDPTLSRNIYHIVNENDPELKLSINVKTGGKNKKIGGKNKKVGGEPQSQNGGISYEKIINDDKTIIKNLQDLFEKLSKCEENCLIICSSRIKDISNPLNIVLNKFKDKGKVLLNITIIHETHDSRNIIFMIYGKEGNQLIRKITNVFPTTYYLPKEERESADSEYEKKKKEIRKTFDSEVSKYEEREKEIRKTFDSEVSKYEERGKEILKILKEEDSNYKKNGGNRGEYIKARNGHIIIIRKNYVEHHNSVKEYNDKNDKNKELYDKFSDKYSKENTENFNKLNKTLKNYYSDIYIHVNVDTIPNPGQRIVTTDPKTILQTNKNVVAEIKKESIYPNGFIRIINFIESYKQPYIHNKTGGYPNESNESNELNESNESNELIILKSIKDTDINNFLEKWNANKKEDIPEKLIELNKENDGNDYEIYKEKFYKFLKEQKNIEEKNRFKNILIIPEYETLTDFDFDLFLDTWNEDKETIPKELINLNPNKDIYNFLKNKKNSLLEKEKIALEKDKKIREEFQPMLLIDDLNKGFIPTIKYGTFFFQIRNTFPPSNENAIEDWWWYRWYYAVPPCASGRLIQMTGTCWFNSALNTILLSSNIANILKIYWKCLGDNEQEKYKIDIQTCLREPPSIKIMLFVIVYNILIKNTKMSINKGNLLEGFAARVATFSKEIGRIDLGLDNSSVIKSLKISEGSDPGEAIQFLLKAIIPSCFEHFSTKQSFEHFSIEQNFDISLPEFSGRVLKSTILKLPNIILIHKIKDKDKENTQDTKYFKKLPLNLNIKFNDNIEKYSLESGIINVKGGPGHAIAALLCNDEKYIYDSNNIIAISDWTNNDFKGYFKALKDREIETGAKMIYGQNDEDIKGVNNVLYIKESFKNKINDIMSDLESKNIIKDEDIKWLLDENIIKAIP